MGSQEITCLLIFICFCGLSALERGDQCYTPLNETAVCKAVDECRIIYDKLLSEFNTTDIKFIQASQCGHDSKPLVCCGSTASYPPEQNYTDLFKLFRKPASKQPIVVRNFDTIFLPDMTVCGIEKQSKRVVGGIQAEIDEFPWMAALEYKSKVFTSRREGIRCGGSLLNKQFVLTAAHCILHPEFEITAVWLGEWRISTDPDCPETGGFHSCSHVVKLKPKQKIFHPGYNSRTNVHDIGLLQLEDPVRFTDFIRPICLPPLDLPPLEVNSMVMVAGWGVTETNRTSDVKRKVEVPLLTNEYCASATKQFKYITENQLCAGGEKGKDSCYGDSGGPLMRAFQASESSPVQWFQEGIVSYGAGCARKGYPAIYTRIAPYISWIIENLSRVQED